MGNVTRKKELIKSLSYNISETLSLKEDSKAILESAKKEGFDTKELQYFANLQAKGLLFDEEEKLAEKEAQLSQYKGLFPIN